MRYELAEKFDDFKLPEEIVNAWKVGRSIFGSLGFTKMIMFAHDVKLTNDDVDYFMNQKPYRTEDETPEQFRQRSRFAKSLLKYRSYIYDYSVYENN